MRVLYIRRTHFRLVYQLLIDCQLIIQSIWMEALCLCVRVENNGNAKCNSIEHEKRKKTNNFNGTNLRCNEICIMQCQSKI